MVGQRNLITNLFRDQPRRPPIGEKTETTTKKWLDVYTEHLDTRKE